MLCRILQSVSKSTCNMKIECRTCMFIVVYLGMQWYAYPHIHWSLRHKSRLCHWQIQRSKLQIYGCFHKIAVHTPKMDVFLLDNLIKYGWFGGNPNFGKMVHDGLMYVYVSLVIKKLSKVVLVIGWHQKLPNMFDSQHIWGTGRDPKMVPVWDCVSILQNWRYFMRMS